MSPEEPALGFDPRVEAAFRGGGATSHESGAHESGAYGSDAHPDSVESGPALGRKPRVRLALPSGLRRLLVALGIIILVLVALPYLLVPLYRFGHPVSLPMLWRSLTGSRVERIYVPLSRIAPSLPLTVIIAEDGTFCRNRGVDFGAIREALQQADDDLQEARGGSTITQQTVKNLFLWQGRSFIRKALEVPLALWMSLVLPKRRVLEIYLNIAEWGPNGEFGVEAGARHAFGKSAHDLTPQEAAELTAMLPNPVRRSARQPSLQLRKLAGVYERRAAAHPSFDFCLRGRSP
jgi:monofunctional biosynthetic peptidoglycan transglycosylase